MATKQIDEQVHAGQADILLSDARFRIVACGRRWGKTVTCAKETRDDLLENGEGWLTWWVAPTYQQAEIGLRTLLDETPDEFVADVNRSKLRVESVTGAVCEFKSADKPDNLRGEGVDKLVVDEAPEVSQYAYENALRPTLTDNENSEMIAIGTPKGRGWFFQFFQRGESDDWPEYESFHGPTVENPFINQSDVEEARGELPDRVFRQEYLAEFVSETGGVFTGLDERLFTAEYDLPPDGLPPLPEDPDDRDPDTVYAEPPYSIGVDLARLQDYRVTVVLDATGRVAYFDRDQGEAWPRIREGIEWAHERYAPGIVSIDANQGNEMFSTLEAHGVAMRMVTSTGPKKRTLIENLITRIENGDLTAPEIQPLRHELEIYEYDVSRAGNIIYKHPDGMHDDTVDALALAVDGMRDASRQNVSTTIRGGRGEDYGDSDGEAIREAVDQVRAQYEYTSKYGK